MTSLRQFKLNGKIMDDWMIGFQKLELIKTMNSDLNMGIIVLRDVDTEIFLGQALTGGAGISFRWGLDSTRCSPWHEYCVLSIDVDVVDSASIVTIVVCDNSIHLRGNSAHASYQNQSKSGLVQQITQNYPIIPSSVVSDSVDQTTYYQTGETDWDFLITNSPNAITKKDGVGDYRLFWKLGNELHFHPPDYSQQPYRWFKVSGGTSTSKYKFRFSPFKRTLKGGEFSSSTGFLKDSVKPFENKETRAAMDGRKTISSRDQNDVVYTTQRSGAVHGLYNVSVESTQELISQQSLAMLHKAYADTYEAEISDENDPKIDPGALIYLDTTSYQKTTIVDGLWLVESVYHIVEGGDAGFTTVRLSRPFISKGDVKMPVTPNSNTSEATGRSSVTEGQTVSTVNKSGKVISPIQLP